MSKSNLGVVILAAGLGTRMKSDKAKVLHEICSRPMIEYVVRTANTVAGPNVVVVVGHQSEVVKDAVNHVGPAYFAFQAQQRGTGHAVLCALAQIPPMVDQVVILCGDVPLIRPATITGLVADHNAHQRDVSILVVAVDNPKGYGRIIMDADRQLSAIVEEADADEAQKKINVINTGIYIINKPFLEKTLPQLRADNKQKEIYLTDIIRFGYQDHRRIGALMGGDSREIVGVNNRDDLQYVENLMKLGEWEKS